MVLKPAQRARKARTTPGVLHMNRKRGDQGMDDLHYTERTGTASNGLRCSGSPFLSIRSMRPTRELSAVRSQRSGKPNALWGTVYRGISASIDWSHGFRRRLPAHLRGLGPIALTPHPSIVKSVAQFDIDLARVVPMEPSERLAVLEVHAAVGHVQGIQRRGDALSEVLANRKVERGVLRQVVTGIGLVNECVTEAGAI